LNPSVTSAAIVAVGSELLSGQIVNRNAAWLSNRLFALGIDARLHLTVDDVEGDILKAIDQAAEVARTLFITGGLGPTSDDLTRNAVAKWAGVELAYDEGSWQHVVELFSRFSNTVPETNRQQCYFPAGAKVLTNAAGTANGFVVEAKGREIWVLPGPPPEVEAVWRDHIGGPLASRIPDAAKKRLKMWRCIGKGESHLAEIVEPLVAGKGLEVAYRAHRPYVELKLRFPESEAEAHQRLLQDVEAALKPWLYEVDGEDVPASLIQRLERFRSIDLYDGCTHGNVFELLAPLLRETVTKPALISCVTSWERHESPKDFLETMLQMNTETDASLAVAGFDANGGWAVGLRFLGEISIEERPSLYKGEAMRPRNLKAISHLATKAWHDMLRDGLN
jgi:molybdenum cofactor synthesis domain-containing protein